MSCASDVDAPHPDLAPTWRKFLSLHTERAFALAGDPRRDRWVAGLSGGHATRAEAEQAALRECERRRAANRLRAACRIYAVGDEIVWQGP